MTILGALLVLMGGFAFGRTLALYDPLLLVAEDDPRTVEWLLWVGLSATASMSGLVIIMIDLGVLDG